MTLLQLRYVLTISRTRSINRAAETLFVSQPTLTSALRELEEEIHITVFRRSNRGVIPTEEGKEFLRYALQVCQQFELLEDRYLGSRVVKRHFAVSTQHYAFVVKAFVETVKRFDPLHFEFAIRETQTTQVIRDVGEQRSELGVLFRSRHNQKILSRLLTERRLEFHRLIECSACVYLWKGHPLAGAESISLRELEPYPCLAFEQGEDSSSFFAEEILSDREYPRMIHTTDRATMLNLMVGLNGYTLCSGIICEELNGDDFITVPYREDRNNQNSIMEIGYIQSRGYQLDEISQTFLEEIRRCLQLPGGEKGTAPEN